jgi:hypothetical protein
MKDEVLDIPFETFQVLEGSQEDDKKNKDIL